jgi:hypothetical protein
MTAMLDVMLDVIFYMMAPIELQCAVLLPVPDHYSKICCPSSVFLWIDTTLSADQISARKQSNELLEAS